MLVELMDFKSDGIVRCSLFSPLRCRKSLNQECNTLHKCGAPLGRQSSPQMGAHWSSISKELQNISPEGSWAITTPQKYSYGKLQLGAKLFVIVSNDVLICFLI